MDFFVGLVIILLLVALLVSMIKKRKKNEVVAETIQEHEKAEKNLLDPLPYIKRRFLSANEEFFFHELKKVTQKYEYELFCKVRIADLVELKKGLNKRQWAFYFGQIKAKHADFVICNRNLQPVLIIELDDKSHDTSKGIKRDSFIDKVYKDANIPILHTRGIDNIEKKFCDSLNIISNEKYQTAEPGTQ